MRRTAAARVSKFRFSILNKYTYRGAADHAKRWAQRAYLGRLDSGGLSLLRIKQASVACSQMALHLNAPSLSSRGHKVLTRNFVVAPKASCNLCCCQINRMNLTRRTSSPKAGMGVGQKCEAAIAQSEAPGTNANQSSTGRQFVKIPVLSRTHCLSRGGRIIGYLLIVRRVCVIRPNHSRWPPHPQQMRTRRAKPRG